MPKDARTYAAQRRTPYVRPVRKQPEPAAGIWTRIRRFFGGQPPTTELGPPQLISNEDDYNSSRITHASTEDSRLFETSYANNDPSRLSQSGGSQLAIESEELGPNEILEQFFAEKGDSDLTNAEVADALSLISQAVSRNESLIDFSNLSESNRTSIEPTETSILRSIGVQQSPRLAGRATPPSVTRSRSSITISQSPWTSPHPYLRQRPSFHTNISLGGQSPRRPAPKSRLDRAPSERPMRSSLIGERAFNDRAFNERAFNERVSNESASKSPEPDFAHAEAVKPSGTLTPAATAILRALDQPARNAVPKTDARAARRNRYIRESLARNPVEPLVETSTETSITSKQESERESSLESSSGSKRASSTEDRMEDDNNSSSANSQSSGTAFPVKTASSIHSVTSETTNKDKPAFPLKPVQPSQFFESAQSPQTPAASLPELSEVSKPLEAPKQSQTTQLKLSAPSSVAPSSLQTQSTALYEQDNAPQYQFDIPVSRTPRDMTPAEEAMVAQSQTEFTF